MGLLGLLPKQQNSAYNSLSIGEAGKDSEEQNKKKKKTQRAGWVHCVLESSLCSLAEFIKINGLLKQIKLASSS